MGRAPLHKDPQGMKEGGVKHLRSPSGTAGLGWTNVCERRRESQSKRQGHGVEVGRALDGENRQDGDLNSVPALSQTRPGAQGLGSTGQAPDTRSH